MSREQSGRELPTELRLQALHPLSTPAFPIAHVYFEVVYAPLLGPTSVLLARALDRRLARCTELHTAVTAELALEVGLRASSMESLGRRSPLANAIDRLKHCRVVEWLDDDQLGLRSAVPPVDNRTAARLPGSALRAHRALMTSMVSDRNTPKRSY